MEPLKDAKPPTAFHDLPQETVVEILTRLLVKTLIRSTSVNKSWYSLIKSPNFISAHIRRSISYSDQSSVLIVPDRISSQNPCTFFSVETCSTIQKFEIPFTTKSGNVKVAGSVNGLVCLTDSTISHCGRHLYLWNPSIRRYRTLVSSCFKELPTDCCRTYCALGFGFHKSTDDYRVVRVLYFRDDEFNYCGKVPPKVEIFSLRRNTWRKIKNPVVPLLARATGVYVNGSVYWLQSKFPGEYVEQMSILSFDFNTEVFGEVKVPDRVRNCLGKDVTFSLVDHEGSISVCCFDFTTNPGVASQPFCIWAVRHEDGAWISRIRVVLKEKDFRWPLKITRSGIVILESVYTNPNATYLVFFNLKNLHGKYLGFQSFGGTPSVDNSFIESLILLEGGNALLRHAK